MNDRLTIGRLALTGPGAQLRKQPRPNEPAENGATFKEALERTTLKFSHHAEARMAQRGIALKPETLAKIVGAIDQAEAKGAKDSLVLYRDIAMIVNVPSRTVVTAMAGHSVHGGVFTQIDSAVVVT
nr:TIGR02530 family flagellar biosynthesis protein [Paenibacillus humicola]